MKRFFRLLSTGWYIRKLVLLSLIFAALTACTVKQIVLPSPIKTQGVWVLESDDSTMLDPQTSGLSFYNGLLYTVSDGSADASQVQKLHKLDPITGKIIGRLGPIQIADNMQSSCFVSYLSVRPDYEGLVALPNQENAWILVTEDATRSGEYSQACKEKFAATGSTEHPTLVVKVELLNNQLMLTGIRALQFDPSDNVGNFPNDGIEGIAITRTGKLLLGLEKDADTKPRVFEVSIDSDTFAQMDTFLPVKDSGLWLPDLGEGNHPINGMDVYYPNSNSDGFLIAAARNDDQLWIMDLAKKQPSKIVNMQFFATCISDNPSTDSKAVTYEIAIAASEGVAVHNDRLYIINDPWKKVYNDNANNTVCPTDTNRYQRMSPLLFQFDIPKCFSDLSCVEK